MSHRAFFLPSYNHKYASVDPFYIYSTPLKKRFASTATSSYREKTFKEAWCSDSGAYPVMGVIAFAVVFSLGYGTYVMTTSPDARLFGQKRKTVFRGELSGADLESKK